MKLLAKTLIAAVALCFGAHASAEIPTGYYSSLDGKSGAALKNAVYEITKNFIYPSTDAAFATTYTNLSRTFVQTDSDPQTNRWLDMYSDEVRYANSFSGLNREHSFPKSWWGGLTNVPAYIDLNHLYPSDMNANSAKLHYPLGKVDTGSKIDFDNGVTKVGYPVTGQGGGAAKVFEPDDRYKGDFARTYFYMATTYQDYTWKYTYMVSSNTYPTLANWAIELLLDWSRNDPVSDKETTRNEAVYKVQNNRNPFIDFPELAEYIWGNKKGQTFSISNSGSTNTGTPTLFTPVQDMELDFGEIALGQSITSRLFFRGEDLTSAVNVRVYNRGEDSNADMFAASSTSIAANLVNSSDGYYFPIEYKPTELGDHSARLLISGGGTSGSLGVRLKGSCLPVPTLTACTATDATIISDNSYIANWTAPDEDIDYFIVTRTMYKNGVATSEELQADQPGLTIEDFNLYDNEAYTVQSVRLGYKSPASNVIYVSHQSGVNGVVTDTPFAIVSLDGAIRFICNSEHTGVQIFDTTGRCIKTIDNIQNNSDINLPRGIYFVTSQQCHRPIKAIVR